MEIENGNMHYFKLQKLLDANKIEFLTAKELVKAKNNSFPDYRLWKNIIPTALFICHIREQLRFITGYDLRIKVISGFRPFGTANNSRNHGFFFAIDFRVLEYSNNSYYKEFDMNYVSKLIWNYYLHYKEAYRIGTGYYKADRFIHVDLLELSYVGSPRPMHWEIFKTYKKEFKEIPISENEDFHRKVDSI